MVTWEQKLRSFAASLPAIERMKAERAVELGIEASRRPIIFRYLGADWHHRDRFELGREGEPLRTVTTTIRGVWWLWAAIDQGDVSDVLRASDFSNPDTKPEAARTSASTAIRNTAAAFLSKRLPDLPELAAAARDVSVARCGAIRYQPTGAVQRFITR